MKNKYNTLLTESHLERNKAILEEVEKNSKLPPLSLTEAMNQYEMIQSQSSQRRKNTRKKSLVEI